LGFEQQGKLEQFGEGPEQSATIQIELAAMDVQIKTEARFPKKFQRKQRPMI